MPRRRVRYLKPVGQHLCPVCQEWKPESEFNGGYCKDCYRKYHQDWSKLKRSDRIREARKAAVDAYGGKCSECDETDPEVMGVYPTHGKGQRDILEYLRARNYPPGHHLLCANCRARQKFK